MTLWRVKLAGLAGLCGVALAALAGGCGGRSGDDGRPRVALIMKARTNPFFARMEEGARAAAAQAGADLTVLSIERETDFDKQAGLIEDVVAQGVAALVIAPADSKAVVAPLLAAQAAGVRIVNVDNRIDRDAASQAGLRIDTFIGPDNEEGARRVVAFLLEQIGGKGKVAILEGIRGVDNAEARKRGFEKAAAAAGASVEVVARESAEWETDLAMQKMEGILQRVPDLDAVFCANDSMALGAIQAIQAVPREKPVRVAGYDNLQAAREAMAKGLLLATVEQHPEEMGRRGVLAALDLARGGSVAPEIVIETEVMTQP